MFSPTRTLLCVIGLISLPALAAPDSVYTSLDKSCRIIQEDEYDSTSRCPGVSGYYLLVEASDIRESVTVVDPRGKKYPLNYWDVVSNAPSRVGANAEWRVMRPGRNAVPQALIVRLIATPYDEKSGGVAQPVSYLAVAKITPQTICVTDRIPGGVNANEKARSAADSAAGRPCLQSVP